MGKHMTKENKDRLLRLLQQHKALGISWLFPSTFGVRAYVRINTMGGTLTDVLTGYRILWIQVAAYFILACLVFRHQIRLARFHALERLDFLMKRKAQRKKQA